LTIELKSIHHIFMIIKNNFKLVLAFVTTILVLLSFLNISSFAVDPLKANKVYFYRFAADGTSEMIGRYRTLPSPTTDEYAYYMDQLIKGPTFNEKIYNGLRSSFILTGPSNCGGANYLKFFNTTTKIMTFSFCKTIVPYINQEGVAGATLKAQLRAKTAIYRTLFISYQSTDTSVRPDNFIIRNRDYSCFAPDVRTQFSEKCE
jgi:hypothetical protein